LHQYFKDIRKNSQVCKNFYRTDLWIITFCTRESMVLYRYTHTAMVGVLIGALVHCAEKKQTPKSNNAVPCATQTTVASFSPTATATGTVSPTATYPLTDYGMNLNEAVTYTGWVQSFMQTNCVGCHQTAQTSISALTTYTDVKNNASKILASLKSTSSTTTPKKMPPTATLDPSFITKFETWTLTGMLENPTSNTTVAVTYENPIKLHIAQYCTAACHNGMGQGPSNLTMYESVKNVQINLVSRVLSTTQPMPPLTSNQLTAQAKADFQAWQTGGFQYSATTTTPVPSYTPSDCIP
jgi:hypothetical protein